VECGNFSWVGGHFADIRARGYLKQLYHAGYRAIVPGAGELSLRAEDADELAKSEVPLVSCNLALAQPLFRLRPYVELAPGWYVSGVTSWRPLGKDASSGSWWRLSDPVAAVEGVLQQLPAGSNLILIATYQPEEVYARLRSLPLAALIGPGSWSSGAGKDESGTTESPAMPDGARDGLPLPAELPPPPAKGVFLPLLVLHQPLDGALQANARFLAVDNAWPDSSEAQHILDGQSELLRAGLADEQARLAEESGVEHGQFGMSEGLLPEDQQRPSRETLLARLDQPLHYLGSDSCAKCHSEAQTAWQASKHSHALATLAQHGEANNLDCLQCHTVGLYERGGFDPNSVKAALGAVGCENCHGPASQHAAAARLAELDKGSWPAAATGASTAPGRYRIVRGDTALCLKCHDSYNSPKFEAGTYWARIRH
jgi:hypothetical protein